MDLASGRGRGIKKPDKRSFLISKGSTHEDSIGPWGESPPRIGERATSKISGKKKRAIDFVDREN